MKIGEGKQGPVNHLFRLSDWEKTSKQSKFRPESLLLYAVTDSSMNKSWGRSTSEAVRGAIEGGATIVQIRSEAISNWSCKYYCKNCTLLVCLLFNHTGTQVPGCVYREKEAETGEFLQVSF